MLIIFESFSLVSFLHQLLVVFEFLSFFSIIHQLQIFELFIFELLSPVASFLFFSDEFLPNRIVLILEIDIQNVKEEDPKASRRPRRRRKTRFLAGIFELTWIFVTGIF